MPLALALTGATGFIGGAVLESLRGRGYAIRALTRRARNDASWMKWIHGDLHQPAALSALLDGTAAVIHCAGTVRGASAGQFHRINAEGTSNLVAVASQLRPPPRFLLISSVAAREPGLSWYAASKRQAEANLQKNAGVMPWTVFRPPAVYGPGDREIRPLLRVMQRGLLLRPGAFHTRFSLIHVDDLVRAIFAWLEAPDAPAGVFELDDGRPGGYDWVAVQAIAEKVWQRRVRTATIPVSVVKTVAVLNLGVSRMLGRAPMLTPGKVRELTHPDWVCHNTALTRALGWSPVVRFEDALRRDFALES